MNEQLIKDLETIFALARIKQVELNPNDEKALIRIIEVKKEILGILTEKHEQ